ncbi:PDDEXK nuclease domain-containing protein [Botryobacter ruber]|uniref:PDDEXK nuclease domain-containing protein n=1 Tax=Botryobacter ruber TaxID=2171629 RepID=UPI000E0BA8B2|nr:PDDEXK nuclease domain-containing protein [Botryobacter ruber]
MKLTDLVYNIQSIDAGFAQEANKAVNQLLTLRNWFIGYYIVEFEQHGEERAQYGEKVLKVIADQLNKSGLSYRNLNLYRQFYLVFPEIGCSLQFFISDKILQTVSAELLESKIRQTLSAQLDRDAKNMLSKEPTSEKLAVATKMVQSLSFSHITLLLTLDDDLKRTFYVAEAIKGTWSVRELKRQINTLLFERSGISKSPGQLIKSIQAKSQTLSTRGLVKDIYTFEFLGLPMKDVVEESDLEAALLDHLREFMLELGNGFCLEARQKRILIGSEYFFIDLVFYHRVLKCHVLIELKVDEFNHANAGQLNTYLNYYKKEVKQENDNDPIGILLVTNKNEALVEYATAGMDQNLFVSKYLLQLPSTDKLVQFIKTELEAI